MATVRQLAVNKRHQNKKGLALMNTVKASVDALSAYQADPTDENLRLLTLARCAEHTAIEGFTFGEYNRLKHQY